MDYNSDNMHPLIADALNRLNNTKNNFSKDQLWEIIGIQSEQLLKLSVDNEELIKMLRELIQEVKLAHIEINSAKLLGGEI